jgi:hypothetical protein
VQAEYQQIMQELATMLKTHLQAGESAEVVYFSIVSFATFCRMQMRNVNYTESYLKKLEQTARNSAITSYNQRQGAVKKFDN